MNRFLLLTLGSAAFAAALAFPVSADHAAGTRIAVGTQAGQHPVWSAALAMWQPEAGGATGTGTTVTAANGIVTAVSATTVTQRTARAPVPALLAGGLATLSVTWSRPFPDTNYSIAPGIYDPAGLLGSVLVTGKTAAGCTVTVKDAGVTALVAGTAAVELTATHD